MLNAIDILLPEPLVKHDGPRTLQLTVSQQSSQGRWILNLLHFIPERRSEELDVIEYVMPLYEVRVSVKVPRPVREAVAVPAGTPLAFSMEGSYVSFEVERIDGHAMVSLRLD